MINILHFQTDQYASCVGASKRVRWDIDRDIIRGRDFEMDRKLLPDSISGIQRFEFLDRREARLLSQIQGRTYANMFGLVERFINCKVLELSNTIGLAIKWRWRRWSALATKSSNIRNYFAASSK
jgi:hypothetical protein